MLVKIAWIKVRNWCYKFNNRNDKECIGLWNGTFVLEIIRFAQEIKEKETIDNIQNNQIWQNNFYHTMLC